MAAYDDLDVKRIFAVGIFSIVITAVTALAVQVLYFALVKWQDAETKAASNYGRQNRILADQQEEISNYGIDAETGNIVIPIEEAIRLMANESETQETTEESSDET
ncbi:MAG: hypothetical protein AAGG48_20395 [Planctomycetota bacterium]